MAGHQTLSITLDPFGEAGVVLRLVGRMKLTLALPTVNP
ncbi:UNVERIFIED_ORG: hypothetical protein ABIB19_001480 [Arthrobacter sp. UYEF10]